MADAVFLALCVKKYIIRVISYINVGACTRLGCGCFIFPCNPTPHTPHPVLGQIPAIALTAYAGEINHQQALSAGFQKHIAKPVEPDTLVAAIASLIKKIKN